ncbi:MAG: DUF4436 domain-containing protein [Proteobacteria bacterium]|jgi:hypothetical protein|nr:DUF4436 domain-containing protein [Pseudomonadota bacterium]
MKTSIPLAFVLLFLTVSALSAKDQGIDDGSPTVPGKEPMLSMNLIGFDAVTGDLRARHNLRIPASEVSPIHAPKQTYYLVDPFDTQSPTFLAIRSQVPYSVYDNFLTSIYQVEDAGSQFLYPFDTHRARIRLFLDREEGLGPGGRPELKRQPFTFDFNVPTFEGYDVTMTPTPDNSPTLLDLEVTLKRTLPIRCYSVFIALLMLLISVSVLRMARKRFKSTEAPEMGEMAFCAALLFAFPAIRNAQPFAPPMGVLSDYLGFFWAESLVAISLIIKLNIWLRRKKHD